jgi:hypothetical protein
VHDLDAIELTNCVPVERQPIFVIRMCSNGYAALPMNFVYDFRRRLSPADALIYSDSTNVKTRCCNLLADKNCWTTNQPRKPTPKLGCKNLVMIGDSQGVNSLTSRLQNESERREQTIVEKGMNVQIRFHNFISCTFYGRRIWLPINERASYDSDQY